MCLEILKKRLYTSLDTILNAIQIAHWQSDILAIYV